MENQYKLIDKNYYRVLLSQAGDKPMILKGRFKRVWNYHVTFTTVRPYIEGIHTKTICSHINILKSEVEKQIEIEKLLKNRIYFIIAYCKEYHDGSGRVGISLASDIVEKALFIGEEKRLYLTDKLIDMCYSFNVEDFKR